MRELYRPEQCEACPRLERAEKDIATNTKNRRLITEIEEGVEGLPQVLEGEREIIYRMATLLTQECTGSVEMQKTEGDTTYTVTLCGSSAMPEGEEHNTVRVLRERE